MRKIYTIRANMFLSGHVSLVEFYIVTNYSMLLLLDNTIITFKNKKTCSKLIESIILKLEFS